MDPGDFGYDLLAALLYGFVGLALMGVGWVVLDVRGWLRPGLRAVGRALDDS